MEDKKIRYNGEEINTTCVHCTGDYDSINLWKNEIWKAYHNTNLVYLKNKTYQNCWIKYKLITGENSDVSKYHMVYTGDSDRDYKKYKFPTIVNLKEYVENGGTLSIALKQAENPDEMYNALYNIHSEIDFSKWYTMSRFRITNFLGSLWFTHAWDAKGVNLGYTGWGKKWTFNFERSATPQGNPDGIYGTNTTYFFAGSNISNMEFRFGETGKIGNAQGMFKALQVQPNITIADMQGNKLVSTAERGFSPYVIIEMFKQTAANLREVPDWINYANVHSMGQFIHDNWVCTKIKGFNGASIGEATQGNTITLNYPDKYGTYPNFNRSNWRVFYSPSLQIIEPLIDMKYLSDLSIFEGTSKLEQVRIRNFHSDNNVNFKTSGLAKIDNESVLYLFKNLFDRSKFQAYTEENKRQIVNKTLILNSNRVDLIISQEWYNLLNAETGLIDNIKSKNYNIVVQ